MSVSQTFLNLTSPQDRRAFLYAVGETHGADHIERVLVGGAVVWVDAQKLPLQHQEQIWTQLDPKNTEDFLPYVFNLAVLANSPSALEKVCGNCTNSSDVFTKISQLLKNLQNFPVPPISVGDFCLPLLKMITNPYHVRTITSIVLHNIHVKMVNNQTCAPDILQCVVDYAVAQKVGVEVMSELVFSLGHQWDLIAQNAPEPVDTLLKSVPFDSMILYGGVPHQKCSSFEKWKDFLLNRVSPLPVEFEDSGFPFTERAHTSWLSFLDSLIPLYQNFGHTINLLEFKGLEEITKNQSGVAVNEYQHQKLSAIVLPNDSHVSKTSKI